VRSSREPSMEASCSVMFRPCHESISAGKFFFEVEMTCRCSSPKDIHQLSISCRFAHLIHMHLPISG
jgi:hypothetical protein